MIFLLLYGIEKDKMSFFLDEIEQIFALLLIDVVVTLFLLLSSDD